MIVQFYNNFKKGQLDYVEKNIKYPGFTNFIYLRS